MPKMEASDRFQGLCLENEPGAGRKYLYIYDMLPPYARELVRNSSFNLCLACLEGLAVRQTTSWPVAIKRMETMIRCKEVK